MDEYEARAGLLSLIDEKITNAQDSLTNVATRLRHQPGPLNLIEHVCTASFMKSP